MSTLVIQDKARRLLYFNNSVWAQSRRRMRCSGCQRRSCETCISPTPDLKLTEMHGKTLQTSPHNSSILLLNPKKKKPTHEWIYLGWQTQEGSTCVLFSGTAAMKWTKCVLMGVSSWQSHTARMSPTPFQNTLPAGRGCYISIMQRVCVCELD